MSGRSSRRLTSERIGGGMMYVNKDRPDVSEVSETSEVSGKRTRTT